MFLHRITVYQALIIATSALFGPGVASAQDKNGNVAANAPPIAQPATVSALPNSSSALAPDPFKRFDDLSLKGWDIPYPRVADSILADHLGIRDALANIGIGISPINTINFQYDFLQNDHGYRGPQLYNGQNFTRTNTTVSLQVTYDLSRIGIRGGQLVGGVAVVNSSLPSVNGPNKARMSRLHYYQEMFDGQFDIKLGYIDNAQEFLGTNVGGNLATGNLGPQATIPFQVGLSYGGFAAAGMNARVKFGSHFYNKMGIQRSLPPGGGVVENQLNRSGFRFSPPSTGVLVIDELGYNRPSSATSKSLWIRGGGIYNSTLYTAFDGSKMNNGAGFFAIDGQLTKIDKNRVFRGIYAGVTFNYAPPYQNLYTQYYEGRIYGVGLLDSRPFDLASLVTTYNKYSSEGLAVRTPVDRGNYHHTWSLIGSYAYRVRAGIYIQPGLGITIHPVYSPRFGTALNGYLGMITIF